MDKNTNCNRERKKKYRCPTCFEWIQLLVTFSVPIAIAFYTFVQNNNDQAIALANREKDLEIARYQREQDLQMANDQQKANILAAYETFLIDHLNHYGMTLNENTSARFIARFKTLTTISQLDRIRKTYLIRSLIEAKLIMNNDNDSNTINSAIISLKDGDLSEITLEGRNLAYLSLPECNLTRAIFSYADLSCANFHSAILKDSNFFRSTVALSKKHCFPKSKDYYRTTFAEAKMNGTNLYQAEYIFIDFSRSFLVHANMRELICIDCLFGNAYIYSADLTLCRISTGSNFEFTNLANTVLKSALIISTTFYNTKFINNQAENANFDQCTFTSLNFTNCILQETSIVQSNFSNVYFNDVNLGKSYLRNVSFINISMHHTDLRHTIFEQCIFIDVNFNDAIFLNVSFLNCIFQQSLISNEQQSQAASFNGSIFS